MKHCRLLFALFVILVLVALIACDAEVYTVSFYDGNALVSSQTVEYGGQASMVTPPAKQGYTFLYWKTDSGLQYNFNSAVTANLNLFTVYEDYCLIHAHDWGTVVFTWNSDYSKCTAQMICKNNPLHIEEETVSSSYVVVSNPTCTVDGEGKYTASFSNATFGKTTETVSIAKLGHSLVFHEGQAATCTENGWQPYYTCSRCGYTTYEEIIASGHHFSTDWSADDTYHWHSATCGCNLMTDKSVHDWDAGVVTTPATCELPGVMTYKCNDCGKVRTETIPAFGHSYDNGTVSQSPTCTTIGIKVYKCATCGNEYEENIKALGHSLVFHEGQAATCEEDGWNSYYTCSRCDHTTYKAIPATGHTYSTAWTKDETYHWHDSTCGHEVVSDKAAHAWNAGEITTQPTCTATGIRTYTCTVCGQTRAETVGVLGHDLVNHAAQAPTCTAIGWNAYDTCSRCDYSTYEEFPAKGHTFSSLWTSDADYHWHDSTCGCDVVSGKASHSWDEGEITTQPTCTTTGVKTYTCTQCGQTKTETVSVLGHDIVHHDSQAATCAAIGRKAYDTCTRCDYSTYQEIPATGHTYSTTWTKDDTYHWHDSTCGHELVSDKSAHAWNTGEITTQPTCTATGIRTYTCTVCGQTRTETVGVLGHDLVNHAAQAPTCTSVGWNAYDTCSRCDYNTYEAIEATGHTYSDAWTMDSVYHWHASECGHSVVSDKSTHSWDEGEITTPPTCTSTGVKTYTCTECGQTKTEIVGVLGHNIVHHDSQAATCTAIGWKAYDTCTRCDYSTYQEIPATGHTYSTIWTKDDTYHWHDSTCGHEVVSEKSAHAWNAGEITTQPTCITTGVKTYTCTVCGQTRKETVGVLGHDLVHHASQVSTCTAVGWNEYYTCSRCDYSTYVELPAKGHTFASAWVHNEEYHWHEATCGCDVISGKASHTWDGGVVTTQPTCTTAGIRTYTCAQCGQTKTEIVSALGHNLVFHPAGAATCEEPGWNAYYTCSRCDHTTYKAIRATGHIYSTIWTKDDTYHWHDSTCGHEVVSERAAHAWNDGEITTQPTCTATGIRTYTCTVCGQTRTETVGMLGHDLVNHAAQVPTCTAIGWNAYDTCSRCDYSTYEELPAKGHTFSSLWTSDADYHWHVSTCGCDVVGSKGSHEWDEGAVTKDPTCTATGIRTYTCSVCSSTKTETVSALDHMWDDGAVTTEPTCITKGVRTYTCSRCSATYMESIPVLGHDWDEGTVTRQPNCTNDGVRTFTCSRCPDTSTEAVTALGHSLVHHSTQEETCTGTGWDAYDTCNRCDYTTFVEIPALGHDYPEEWTTDGTHHWKVCERCLLADTKIEHDFEAVVIDPTCTEDGCTRHTCSECDYFYDDEVTTKLGHSFNAGNVCTRCGHNLYGEYMTISGTVLTQFTNTSITGAVTIPDGITEIGERAFYSCSKITEVIIPNTVKTIGTEAFRGCKALAEMTIPDSVETIGMKAFSSCSALTELVIPNSVTSIGDSALYGCTSLIDLTLPFIGSSRTASGTSDAVFGYIFGTNYYADATATIQYCSDNTYSTYYIPNSLQNVSVTDITFIPYGAFQNCTFLTEFEVVDGVVWIGQHAFENCSNLTSVSIPDSCKMKEYNSFAGCGSIDMLYITIPDNWLYGETISPSYFGYLEAKMLNGEDGTYTWYIDDEVVANADGTPVESGNRMVVGSSSVQLEDGNHTIACEISIGTKVYTDTIEVVVDETGVSKTGTTGLGYVFYDKGSYSDGWRYLEAAPEDLKVGSTTICIFGYYRTTSSGSDWYVNGRTSYVEGTSDPNDGKSTGTAIGTGKANTAKLVKAMGSTAYTNSSGTGKTDQYAAKLANDYVYGCYDDWFLPSKDELNLMYKNLHKAGLGGFASDCYWSSSEFSNNAVTAWIQHFGSGDQDDGSRSYDYRVRCIRAF